MKNILKILAMIVWYIGFVALSLKSYKLFAEAYSIDNNFSYLVLFLLIGFLLSLLKTKYIFRKSCQKNLQRIYKLEEPKLWQFYRIGFFIFLLIVISLGAFLSRLASGDYYFLLSVGVIDMALALALFFSGFEFFRRSRSDS
jgi:hypothetical protein